MNNQITESLCMTADEFYVITEMIKESSKLRKKHSEEAIELSDLNYNMADISHVNNEVEDKIVKSISKEMECFNNIKNEVSAMAEVAKFPIEGSKKIIENGQTIESLLKKVIDNVKK